VRLYVKVYEIIDSLPCVSSMISIFTLSLLNPSLTTPVRRPTVVTFCAHVNLIVRKGILRLNLIIHLNDV